MPPDGRRATLGVRAVGEGMRFIAGRKVVLGALLSDLSATALGMPFALFRRSTPTGSAAPRRRWACSPWRWRPAALRTYRTDEEPVAVPVPEPEATLTPPD
jgi:hypothetical protein